MSEACLVKKFDNRELGKFNYFIGIEILHSNKGIFNSYQKYVTELLREMGKLTRKLTST